jgi:LPS-assembly protein
MRSLAALLACLIAFSVAGSAPAQDLPDRSPVLLSADQITYDESLGIVVASGHVEVAQGERVLLADSVTYNERTGTVTASGNVSLTEPNGDVLFASYAELTDDMKDGVITNIRLLLSDRSRAAAAVGRRIGGTRTELDKAVFSPCALCEEDPMRPPLWQLKAVKVIHNQETKTIEYQDAWMEIYGVPVIYTPYLSHPDPTVKRKSGFLSPSFGLSDELGFQTQVPYFWAISPDKDATIAPLFTTKQGLVLAGQYRQRVVDGEMRIDGSATYADHTRVKGGVETVEKDFRGHIDALGRFDINNHWRWGFDAKRASDKTYLRLYDFSNERTLTSRLFAEGFHARNYSSFRAFAFQGLRDSDDNGEQPIVAPLFDYNFLTEPSSYGGYYTLDLNGMVLTREDGRDSRRLSLRGGWTLPYTAPAGDIYTLRATMRVDGYNVNDVDPQSDDPDPEGPTISGFEGRVFPQLAFDWRYPFVRNHETFHQIVEPMVGVVVGPNGGNPGEIPNEDSRDLEFDDTNLFAPSRFTGLDRVDGGQRVNYGLRWSLIGNNGLYTSAFLGQSYAFSDNDAFQVGSGLEDQLSDIVGRLLLSPHRYVDLLYRFRFSSDDLKAQRNEVDLRLGPPALNLDLTYAFLGEEQGVEAEFGKREEISAIVASQFTDNWSAYVAARRDLVDNSWLSYGAGLTYQDECFAIRGTLIRSEFDDEETDPETKLLVSVSFKYLGDVQAGF